MEAAEGVGVEPVVEAAVVPPPLPHAARDRLTVASSANIDPLTLFIGISPLCNHHDFPVSPYGNELGSSCSRGPCSPSERISDHEKARPFVISYMHSRFRARKKTGISGDISATRLSA
jgi:hypothetical protein